jgi:hypothetical protein
LAGGDPALVDCAHGEGRVLVLASDLDNRWNDFPLHATFVPFVHALVRYLGSARSAASAFLIGDQSSPVHVDAPGVKSIEINGASRLVAVNVDARESDPARMSADEFRAAITRMKEPGTSFIRPETREQEARQHIWQYLLMVMVAVLVMESLVARRTA